MRRPFDKGSNNRKSTGFKAGRDKSYWDRNAGSKPKSIFEPARKSVKPVETAPEEEIEQNNEGQKENSEPE